MSRSHASTPLLDEPARRTPVRYETEVLVVGGGTAGVSAAVAAARDGADVLLVERYGYLGGLATGGLIILLLTLDDGRGRQVVGGLCQEVTDRLARRGEAYFPPRAEWGSADEERVQRDFRWGLLWGHGPHRVRYSVAFDPEGMKFSLSEMLEESGARVLFHAWACDAIVEGDRLAGVTFQGKSGRFAVRARVVIDATGDGDVFAGAGCGHEREEVLPWLWFTMGGVEDATAAIDAGGGCFHTIGEGKVLFPWGATEKIARRIDATSPEDLTYAELECRKRVMAEVERVRRELPAAGAQRAAAPGHGPRAGRRRGRDGSLDQVRRRLPHSLRLPAGERAAEPAGGGPLHLGRSPRAPRHQGDPGVHGNR
jgi:hypothetical protein